MPADLKRCALLAADLEKARETARFLFGEKYEKRVEPWREFVRKAVKTWECSPLDVPLRLQQADVMPKQPLALYAAVVDVTEEPDRG